MDVAASTAAGVSATGLVVMLIGYATRHKGGRCLFALGAALSVGSMSPLMTGRVTEPVQILFSAAALLLAAAGVVIAVLDIRRRFVPRERTSS
jgi:hypothetical protein